VFDLSKEYGIVLEGGGARGAYQIGAWKALDEKGVKIKGVVGTSVGSLNGALIAQKDIEKALDIWENITYSMVMDVDDNIFENLQKFNLKDIDFHTLMDNLKMAALNMGFDITPLKNLIASSVSEELVRESGMDFGLVTVSLTDRKPLELFLNDIPAGELQDYLLASSYLPMFKSEKLKGKKYLDGGFFDKAPIKLLIDKGYKDIIVIRINAYGMSRKVDLKAINVYSIEPNENLGGVIEFNKEKTRYNINLGYYDALRFIEGLKGNQYYIHCKKTEKFFIGRFLNVNKKIKRRLIMSNVNQNTPLNRYYLNNGLNNLARDLKLGRNWNYIDLGLAIIEHVCEILNIERFKIYEYEEIVKLIQDKGREYKLMIGYDQSSDELDHILCHFIKVL
jgi:NTE family protein